MKLNDKVAVITGAARGIGKAIAERYVREGARVVVSDLNEQGAKAVASELGPNAVGLILDVTDQASIDAMVAATVSQFGASTSDAMFAKYENLKPGEKKRIVGASVPFGRMARPDEIGGLATFLASEDADYIVAQTYNIDGGNWMS
jgi:NAD(P)-dependent dehydrogenase (short-subunit alcohol dehydrogenase family)